MQAGACGKHPAGKYPLDFAFERNFIDLDKCICIGRFSRRPRIANPRGNLERAELHRFTDRRIERNDAAGDFVEPREHGTGIGDLLRRHLGDDRVVRLYRRIRWQRISGLLCGWGALWRGCARWRRSRARLRGSPRQRLLRGYPGSLLSRWRSACPTGRRRQRLSLDARLLWLAGWRRVLLAVTRRLWRILLPVARRGRLRGKPIGIGYISRRPGWRLAAKKIAKLSCGGVCRDRRAGQGQNNGNADHGTVELNTRSGWTRGQLRRVNISNEARKGRATNFQGSKPCNRPWPWAACPALGSSQSDDKHPGCLSYWAGAAFPKGGLL
jgi:hypothetical protein